MSNTKSNASNVVVISDITTFQTEKGATYTAIKSGLKDAVLFRAAKSQKMYLMKVSNQHNLPGYFTLTGGQVKQAAFIRFLVESGPALIAENNSTPDKKEATKVDLKSLKALAGLK
jgi:hypothetical protein